jgi:plastocyanin
MVSNSCNKSTAYNTPTTGGTGGTGSSGGPGANEVFIQGMAFNPSSITVTAGTTITWTNKDAVAHTVTSKTNAFDSGNLGTNSTFSFTFATAGSYSYYCKVHPSMVATVTVN